MMFTVTGYIRVIQEDEMGETHSAHEDRGDQQNVLVEKPKGRNRFGDHCVREV